MVFVIVLFHQCISLRLRFLTVMNTHNCSMSQVFYAGCYTIESFFDQTCLDDFKVQLIPADLTSQYFPTTTIEDLLNNLMVEQWNIIRSYDRYYNECQPIECIYTIETRNNAIFIVTRLISIIDGVIKICKIINPILIKIVVDCLQKWRHRVRPLIINDSV